MLEWLLLGLARDAPVHPTRARILEVVEAQPGVTLTDLRDAVGCSWGTIQHHTRALEKRGVLRSEPLGRSRRLFTDATPSVARRGIALLRRGRVRELADAIAARPGCIQRDLTEGLQLTRKVLRTYVDALMEQGLVVEARASRSRTYHPTSELQALLVEVAARREEPVRP